MIRKYCCYKTGLSIEFQLFIAGYRKLLLHEFVNVIWRDAKRFYNRKDEMNL